MTEINSKLSVDLHLGKVISRAYQRINLIIWGFDTKDPAFLTNYYLSFVRPVLEYCTPIWSPHLKNGIDALEQAQKYLTRIVHGLKSLITKKGCLFLI